MAAIYYFISLLLVQVSNLVSQLKIHLFSHSGAFDCIILSSS